MFVGQRVGYARVSATIQDLSLQRERLSDCDRIFEEKVSGKGGTRGCKILCVNGRSRLHPVTTGGTTDGHIKRRARCPDEGLQES